MSDAGRVDGHGWRWLDSRLHVAKFEEGLPVSALLSHTELLQISHLLVLPLAHDFAHVMLDPLAQQSLHRAELGEFRLLVREQSSKLLA